jgi:hypothetical protein
MKEIDVSVVCAEAWRIKFCVAHSGPCMPQHPATQQTLRKDAEVFSV